jgi:hypothetical protein
LAEVFVDGYVGSMWWWMMEVVGVAGQHCRKLESLHRNNKAKSAAIPSFLGFAEHHKQEGAS